MSSYIIYNVIPGMFSGMANPRRGGLHLQIPTTAAASLEQQSTQTQQQQQAPFSLSSLAVFLKRPQAFPFLLSIFILLTWISLRFQQPQPDRRPTFPSSSRAKTLIHNSSDVDANLARFSSVEFPSQIFKDQRGWLLDPVTAALEAGITGGAQSCASVHLGGIQPGSLRGNHRHHTCNETFIIWGAKTSFRLENAHADKRGYAEVTIGANEIAVAASPSGTAHALINIDQSRTTFFLGCQDSIPVYNNSATDFNVWKDL